jgi:sorting nexin-3/12
VVQRPRTTRGVTMYEIVSITNIKKFKRCYYRVYKRYTDFYNLHMFLRGHIPALPDFPRKYYYTSLTKKVIDARVKTFNIYLRYISLLLIRNEGYEQAWGREVLKFLTDEDINK